MALEADQFIQRRFGKVAGALGVLVVLASCSGEGGGYTQVRYHQVPYTMERTAGTGIAYVRASLLPARGLNTEENAPMAASPAPPVTEMTPGALDSADMSVMPAEHAEIVQPAAPVIEKVTDAQENSAVKHADSMFNKKQRK